MDVERKKFLIRSSALLLIGLLVFVVYLVFFVNIGEMIEKISQANPFIYALTFVAALLDVFFFALAWRYLMRALSVRVSVWKTYVFIWVSIFIDSIIPAESVSGEISRAYLMSREPEAETGKVVVSLVIHRIIMVLITIVTLLSGVLVLFVSGYTLSAFVMYLIWLVTIVAAAFLACVFVLLVKEKWMERFVDLLLRIACRIFRGRWRLGELRERALVEVRSFYDGLETLGGDLKHFVLPVVFSFVSWIFSILVLFMVFVSLGFSISWTLWSIVVVVFSLIVTIKSVPVGVPAEVGLPEIAMTFLFTAMGIAPGVSAAVTILSRLVSFAFKFVVGFVATQWVGIKTIMDGMKLGQKDEV